MLTGRKRKALLGGAMASVLVLSGIAFVGVSNADTGNGSIVLDGDGHHFTANVACVSSNASDRDAYRNTARITTTERLIFYTGLRLTVGEVHEHAAMMDWMEVEAERGISIANEPISYDNLEAFVDAPARGTPAEVIDDLNRILANRRFFNDVETNLHRDDPADGLLTQANIEFSLGILDLAGCHADDAPPGSS